MNSTLRFPITRRRRRTVEALLDAAVTVFARKGYERASLDEIADLAGFSKGAVYSNFDSKEDLFLAVVEERSSRYLDTLLGMMQLAPDFAIEQSVGQAASWLCTTLREPDDWIMLDLELQLRSGRDSGLRQKVRRRFDEQVGRLAEVVQKNQEAGGGEPTAAPEVFARSFATILYGMACQACLGIVPDEKELSFVLLNFLLPREHEPSGRIPFGKLAETSFFSGEIVSSRAGIVL